MGSSDRFFDYKGLVALILTILVFGISQSIIHWGPTAFQPEYLWGSVAVFVLPVFAIYLLFALSLRWILNGAAYPYARTCAWTGFLIRLACAAILPLVLYASGITTGLQEQGVFTTDAQINEQHTWKLAQSNNSLLEITGEESHMAEGGLAVLGVFLYRFFSPSGSKVGMDRGFISGWCLGG
jgi:hypothetical protein